MPLNDKKINTQGWFVCLFKTILICLRQILYFFDKLPNKIENSN